MRSAIIAAGAIAVVALAGCGGSGSDAKPEHTAITAPATQASTVVGNQNQQLQDMEQRTSQADPTVP